jgi:hypothetical protein
MASGRVSHSVRERQTLWPRDQAAPDLVSGSEAMIARA